MAEQLAPVLSADKEAAKQAAQLCKADLVSGLVYEFPELQGIMGGYYAQNDGLGDASPPPFATITNRWGRRAIPETGEARAVALADKIDSLAGFGQSMKSRPVRKTRSRCAAPAGHYPYFAGDRNAPGFDADFYRRF